MDHNTWKAPGKVLGTWWITSNRWRCLAFVSPSLMACIREGIFLQVLAFSLFPEGQETFCSLGMWCLTYFCQSTRRSSVDCALGIATGVLLCPLHETGTLQQRPAPPALLPSWCQPEAEKLQLLLLVFCCSPLSHSGLRTLGRVAGLAAASATGSAPYLSPCPSTLPAPHMSSCTAPALWSSWIRSHLPTVWGFWVPGNFASVILKKDGSIWTLPFKTHLFSIHTLLLLSW